MLKTITPWARIQPVSTVHKVTQEWLHQWSLFLANSRLSTAQFWNLASTHSQSIQQRLLFPCVKDSLPDGVSQSIFFVWLSRLHSGCSSLNLDLLLCCLGLPWFARYRFPFILLLLQQLKVQIPSGQGTYSPWRMKQARLVFSILWYTCIMYREKIHWRLREVHDSNLFDAKILLVCSPLQHKQSTSC